MVLRGDRVLDERDLVAAFSEVGLFDYEILSARPPCPAARCYKWQVFVRHCADEGKRWVWLSPEEMNASTCKDLAELFNAQRGVKRPDGFPYCLEPHVYQDVTPVSRIMRRGCVAPPAMPLRTLLVNLWGDQPGSWAFALPPTYYDASGQSIDEHRRGNPAGQSIDAGPWVT